MNLETVVWSTITCVYLSVCSSAHATQYAPHPYMRMPAGWTWTFGTEPLTMANYGWRMFANRSTQSAAAIAVVSREGVSDSLAHSLKWLRAQQVVGLTGTAPPEISQIEVNGRPAWRFQHTGSWRGQVLTYVTTIIEGKSEIAILSAWTYAWNFDRRKNDLLQLSADVVGLQ